MSRGGLGADGRTVLFRTGVAFLGSLGLLAGLLWVVGLADVVGALSTAPGIVLVGVGMAALTAIAVWGIALALVLRILGIRLSYAASIPLFVATLFANNVTPFGRLGGDPVNGFLVARVAHTDYETGLAAIASTNTLNSLASALLGVVGFAILGGQVAFGRGYTVIGISLIGVTLLTVVAAVIGWRRRYGLSDWTARVLTPIARVIGTVVPGLDPPAQRAIAGRTRGFVVALERLVSDPHRLVVVFCLSIGGQLFVAASLWLSIVAIGHKGPAAVVLVVIPLARLASFLPTPGGLASVEAALVGLLVATVGMGAAGATAAVLVYRAATFFLPTVLGGGVTAAVILGR